MSHLGRCPSCRESKEMTEEWQGPTLSIYFMEVSILLRVKKITEEWQGPTLGVWFREASIM